MSEQKAPASPRSLRALDALNVTLADVRDGLGPYLAIYLATRGWDAGRVGIAMAAMGVASVAAQTPAGAFIDRTHHKRTAVAIAALAVAIAAVAMVGWTTLPSIIAAQATIGVASAIFAPAIAAISLGLVGHAAFARRTGRNEAFNHAGNVVAAILAGAIGDMIAYEGIFYLLAFMCLTTMVCVFLIRRPEIDDNLARGTTDRHPEVAKLADLFKDRRILIFGISIVLFHFANAAMLPLVGQKLTAGKSERVALDMSYCIIAAQLVMVPVAIVASRLAESWGRRPVFLIGFAVLPIRGLLYTMTNNPTALIAIQLLDGIGAGIFGVVGVLVIADLTRGTGRFNMMQGALATATGLGASASNLMTGFIVKAGGFNLGYLTLSTIAAAALVFYALAMPETRDMIASHTQCPLSNRRANRLGFDRS
jgi:MFS family permease